MRTEPRSVSRHVNGEARTKAPEVPETTPTPEPVAEAAASLPFAPTVAVVAPPPPAEVELPTMPVAEARSDAVPVQAPLPADSAPAPSPEPVGALPTRALEQVVGEMLEPVIRQWLQTNLPRLIEKAVREEVVRALAAERDAAKV